MAFASSRSRIEAQDVIIKPCDLCEDDDDVNWFCKNCFQNLCERCKKMHPKIVSFKDHHLVSVLEGLAITKENVSNLCQDHGEPFSFFCRQCEQNICSNCLYMIHSKHEFVDIRVFQTELHSTLQEALKRKEDEKKKIEENLDAFVKYKHDCDKILDESFATINETRNALQSAVAKECEEMKIRTRTVTDQSKKIVEESRIKGQINLKAYNDKIQNVKQQLQLQTAATINQFVKTSISSLQSLKPSPHPIPERNKFIQGSINKEQIREMIGKFVSIDEISKSEQGKPEDEYGGSVVLQQLKVVRVYYLDVQTECYSICTSPCGCIWIGSKAFVYKMNSDFSTILHEISSNGYTCLYIACLQSGDAVVSYGGFSKIDRITSNGSCVNFKKFSPLRTCDIAVTDQDQVIVSVAPSIFSSSIRSRERSLVIISNMGKQLKEIKMTKPIRGFCIGKDGNLIISYEESTCLTVIDRNGAVLKEIQTTIHGLRRLRCDRLGNILGVSKDGKAVGFISEDGQVERLFQVECNYFINNICIDSDNHLLILVDEKKVIFAKYLE